MMRIYLMLGLAYAIFDAICMIVGQIMYEHEDDPDVRKFCETIGLMRFKNYTLFNWLLYGAFRIAIWPISILALIGILIALKMDLL